MSPVILDGVFSCPASVLLLLWDESLSLPDLAESRMEKQRTRKEKVKLMENGAACFI